MNWNRISFVVAVLIVVTFTLSLIVSVSQAHWWENTPQFQECDVETRDDTLSRREQWSVFRQCVWEFHPHGKNPPR